MMDDQERLRQFLKVCAEELVKRKMAANSTSSNMMFMEIIGIAVMRLIALEDKQRGFLD